MAAAGTLSGGDGSGAGCLVKDFKIDYSFSGLLLERYDAVSCCVLCRLHECFLLSTIINQYDPPNLDFDLFDLFALLPPVFPGLSEKQLWVCKN